LEAGGTSGPFEMGGNGEEGWKTRAVLRMPNHEKIRPSTNPGTITPIRVSHEMLLQVFYSVDGEHVNGMPREGPGELRMMQVKLNINIPSCCCTVSSLILPTYDIADNDRGNIDEIFTAAPSENKMCMCGSSFAELGEAAMRKMQQVDQEELEERTRALGIGKEEEARSEASTPGPSGDGGLGS